MLELSNENIELLTERYTDPFTVKIGKVTLKIVQNYLKQTTGKTTEDVLIPFLQEFHRAPEAQTETEWVAQWEDIRDNTSPSMQKLTEFYKDCHDEEMAGLYEKFQIYTGYPMCRTTSEIITDALLNFLERFRYCKKMPPCTEK